MTSVTLRTKKGKHGKAYLFLDYYPPYFDPLTRKTKRQEYLKMFVYTRPATVQQKEYNRKVMANAEMMRNKRSISVLNQETGLFDSDRLRLSFLKYFEEKIKGKPRHWQTALQYFSRSVNGECAFGNLDVRLCQKYREYLLNEAVCINPMFDEKNRRKISSTTASKNFAYFRNILREAFRDRYLKENLYEFLDPINGKSDTRREFLTEPEIKKLYKTPCKYDVLKRAAMFSIYTGLRLSDIIDLKWKDITTAPDGQPCIRKKMIKCRREVTVFVSENALKFCGPKGHPDRAVFHNFRQSMTVTPLKNWIKDSGIRKHITFHCFRHTHATLLISKGIDIYTVSGMLTHSDIKTTQVYTHLIDSKKRDAAHCIENIL